MKKLRILSFISILLLFIIILLVNSSCVSRGNSRAGSGETKDKTQEELKVSDVFVDFLQISSFGILLPDGWRVYRDTGNENILHVVNAGGIQILLKGLFCIIL